MELSQTVSRVQKRKNDGKFVYDSDVINNEVWAAMTATTDASTSLYDVPAGNKFHIRTMFVYNPDITASLVELHMSGSTLVIPINIPSGPTAVVKTSIVGPFWDSDGVYLSYTPSFTTAAPLEISIGGILEPKE